MPPSEIITSRSNPVIKSARMLREGKERKRTGKFLVEGILHVGEASAADWQIDSILYAPELLESDYARNLISEPIGQRYTMCSCFRGRARIPR